MNEAFKPEVAERANPAPAPDPATPAPEAEPKARPRRRLIVRIGLVVVLAAAAIFAWQAFERRETQPTAPGAPGGPSASPPQTVRVAPVVAGDMPITLDALGTVTPFATVTMRTQIAGTLMEIGFTEGQMVKKGDFIAQIDPKPYQAALAQAQGQLAKDQALLAQAQGNLDRFETLSRQDSIARQQVTDQEALVKQDQAAIQTDQAQVQTAQINLNYTRILSPIDGRVGIRLVDPGNYLQPSDTGGIVVVTALDPISVIFSTAEDNLPRIAARMRAGAKLPVTAFNRANVDRLAEGTLTAYDSQIDVSTGTVKMRATFANPDFALFPQQFVNVRLLIDTLRGVALAPNAAVQIGPIGHYVYLLSADGTVAKRDVATGPSDGASTTITSGLAAGDQVVIDGVDRLRDGAKVNVVGAPGAPDAHTPAGGAEAAKACAAKLSLEAKAIYDAAAPGFAAAEDPRGFVRGKVQDLVKAGSVQKDGARASAMAARDCLVELPAGGAAAQPGADAGKAAAGTGRP